MKPPKRPNEPIKPNLPKKPEQYNYLFVSFNLLDNFNYGDRISLDKLTLPQNIKLSDIIISIEERYLEDSYDNDYPSQIDVGYFSKKVNLDYERDLKLYNQEMLKYQDRKLKYEQKLIGYNSKLEHYNKDIIEYEKEIALYKIDKMQKEIKKLQKKL